MVLIGNVFSADGWLAFIGICCVCVSVCVCAYLLVYERRRNKQATTRNFLLG